MLVAVAAGQPEPTLEEMRATFDAQSDLYPVPGDVATEVDAGACPPVGSLPQG